MQPKVLVKRLVQDHKLDMKVIEVKYTLDYKSFIY